MIYQVELTQVHGFENSPKMSGHLFLKDLSDCLSICKQQKPYSRSCTSPFLLDGCYLTYCFPAMWLINLQQYETMLI